MSKEPMCIPLTSDLRTKMNDIADQIIDILQANFSPMEAYSLLHMLKETMEKTYGISAIQVVKEDDPVN